MKVPKVVSVSLATTTLFYWMVKKDDGRYIDHDSQTSVKIEPLLVPLVDCNGKVNWFFPLNLIVMVLLKPLLTNGCDSVADHLSVANQFAIIARRAQ